MAGKGPARRSVGFSDVRGFIRFPTITLKFPNAAAAHAAGIVHSDIKLQAMDKARIQPQVVCPRRQAEDGNGLARGVGGLVGTV